MTIDKSLKVEKGLIKNRSVLTRAERISRLKELDRWGTNSTALGLPKVRVLKLSLKKKKTKKKEEGEAAADTAKKPEAKKPEGKKK
jgi:small basic protein (TIGR04137 family)